MSNIKRGGFVLLEVLPALLVMMGAFVISARMLSLSVENRLHGQQILAIEDILLPVCEEWRLNGGSIALVSDAPGIGWLINTFPDETWLPVVSSQVGSDSIVFRRRQMDNLDGWEVSRLAGGEWQVMTGILSLESNGLRE